MYTSLREQDAHNIRAGIHMGGVRGNAVEKGAAYFKVLKNEQQECTMRAVTGQEGWALILEYMGENTARQVKP